MPLTSSASVFSPGWIAAALSFVWGAAMAAAQPVAPAASVTGGPADVITTVSEAAAVWAHLSTEERSVRIEGVVTGTMPSGAFRLHDGEVGIFVAKSVAGQSLRPRDRVAVSGTLRQGGFSPWITPQEVVSLGEGTYPPARDAPYSMLASGTADNQWLEIEGVVRSAVLLNPPDFIELDLGMAGGNLRVLVNHSPGADFKSLVDARVRLRGVAAVNVNKHGHVVEPSFRVPSFSEITVTRPPPADAFAQPLVPFSRVMRGAPDGTKGHRVRTSGVVTRRLSDRMFFIRDGDLGLKVEMERPVTYRAGDTVEVAGFPLMTEGLAVLEHSLGRVVSKGAPPAPARPSMAALIDGSHNSNLVSIQARLVDWAVTGRNVTLIFQSGDQLFKGLLNRPAGDALELPERNSVVNVTGICVISELEDIWFYQPRTFLLLVAGLADVEVVQTPPWWTSERLWRALAITGAVLLAGAVWVWALRRQVGQKRAVIEQQARHAAALEERSRIARELHDTLEQGLTGLSLQMKAMETDLDGMSHPVRSRLQSARQMLRQSRALARNAIRELRTEAVPARNDGLVDGLKRVVDSWNHSGALKVELQIVGSTRALPPRVERHLLGIGTEAMTNAVKHGCADSIQVEVDFRASDVAVRIRDNGGGFDPEQQLENASGCFGLLGMRERARELRGELRINSSPGAGAEIVVTAPFSPAVEVAPAG
jgi:signal transduction histidine kinase